MDDLIKEFLAESREGLDRMDVCLTALEARPRDKDLLSEIFRAVHTMKGATGFLGYPRLERLTHTGETLLSLMRDGVVIANEKIIDALFQLMDRLRGVIDLIDRAGREGNRASDDDSEIIAMLDALRQPPAESSSELPALAERLLLQQAGVEVAAECDPRQTASEKPVPPEVISACAGEDAQVAILIAVGPAEDEAVPDASPKVRPESENREVESTVRVDVHVLDRMVHLVGELVLIRNQLQKRLTDENGSLEVAERLDALTQELRITVMQARMLPLAQLFQRFPRMVRDLAKACSKRVRVEFAGQETALDRSLIEAIKDPLTHTLRNAIDHGIECACDRFTAGKPAEGVVRLRARQQSGWVVIEVSDDGAGICKQRLIARAIERGNLNAEQAAVMSDREAMDLIFEPGFSTAAAVTHISGRGVGMDVVRSQVERVGGSVEVESEVGVGTVVRLRVPLTLAIVPAWIVRVGDHSFCIPQNALTELACVQYRDAERLCSKVHAAEVYRLRDELLPMVSLDDVLGLARQRGPLGFYVAVVNVDEVRFALVVDDVVAAEEIVVKPVSSVVRELGVYSGATILGDGDVAMVLDMPAIANRAGIRNQGRRAGVLANPGDAASPTVLLAEIDGRDGTPQRVAFPIEGVERIERVCSASLERIGGRLLMAYKGEALPVEDTEGIFQKFTAADEATLLICSGIHGTRWGVLVSRVVEVETVAPDRVDWSQAGLEIALFNERLTVLRTAESSGITDQKGWREVA